MSLMYSWREHDGQLSLVPTDTNNVYSLRRIVNIYRRDCGQYVSSYYFPQSTGNRQSGRAYHKTRRGAQRWAERQLAKFWEPPTILNPAT